MDDTRDAPGSFVSPSLEELAPLFPSLEIQACIGKGGMGVVYRARQKELDRVVALKILPPGIGRDPSFAERFSREARALAKLNHPGIVTIHESGQTGGLYFILMEYVDGLNLRQLLLNGRISPREALAIVPQVCDALQFAHDRGIVHRDIKPENLLIDRSGRVKVADFGLAKLTGTEAAVSAAAQAEDLDLTQAGRIMGTPRYMAPEQSACPDAVDHRADIYALGVVLYQMLTGELPGERLDPPSKKIRLDVRLDEVVLRALEKEPERRYPSATEFKTRLTLAQAGMQSPGRARRERVPPEPVSKTPYRIAEGILLMAGFLMFSFDFPDYQNAWLAGCLAILASVAVHCCSWGPKGYPAAVLIVGAPGLIWCLYLYAVLPSKPSTAASLEAEKSGLPQLASSEAEAPAADPARVGEKPRLRHVAWLEPTKGSPVSAGKEGFPEGIGMEDSSAHDPARRYLCLWFSHPLFDKKSIVNITLRDEAGAKLSGSVGWNSRPAEPQYGNTGWIIASICANENGATPSKITVSLLYGVGDWEIEEPIKSDFKGFRALDGDSSTGMPLQNLEGRTFLQIHRNEDREDIVNQFDFVAIDQNGGRLPSERNGQYWNFIKKVGTETCEFDAPLARIREFECRKRLIRQADWTVEAGETPLVVEAEKNPAAQESAGHEPAHDSRPSTAVLVVHPDGRYEFEGEMLASGMLGRRLRMFSHDHPGLPLLIQGVDSTVPAHAITFALECCQEAGISEITFDSESIHRSPTSPPAAP
jgi:predicted Ser/Thr protein kinase